MRLLVLNVDRDDDLGRKTGIRAPIIGREAMMQAATALAVADPEEADANGMFAAIKEFDEINRRKTEYEAEEVFVGAVTGHVREGLLADNAIAHQLDEIIKQTGCEAVILVSDGAEDEHILPMLKTRVKVNGVKRVIVKQARNLEGALYLFNRLIHDEKLQRRFFMPLAVLLIAAGAAVLWRKPELFLASALFLSAIYILIQVFSLNEPIGALFDRIAQQMRTGKISLVASVLALVIVIVGGFRTLQAVEPASTVGRMRYSILFLDSIYWWVVAALVLIVVGRGLDRYVRHSTAHGRHWEVFLFTLAFAMIGFAFLGLAERLTRPSATTTVEGALSVEFATWIFFGGFLFFTGLIAHRYVQQLNAARAAEANPPGRT